MSARVAVSASRSRIEAPVSGRVFAPDPLALASAAVWTAAGALALAIGLGSPLDALQAGAAWCGFDGAASHLGGHCALCWGGAAALIGGLVQGALTLGASRGG